MYNNTIRITDRNWADKDLKLEATVQDLLLTLSCIVLGSVRVGDS